LIVIALSGSVPGDDLHVQAPLHSLIRHSKINALHTIEITILQRKFHRQQDRLSQLEHVSVTVPMTLQNEMIALCP
jgi:hypothetical protein